MSYDHAGHPGFFVNAFNDVYSRWEKERTWWEILDGDLKHTPVGTRTSERIFVVVVVVGGGGGGAMSTFSPVGSRSSNGMRMCVRVCVCVYMCG